MKLDPGIHIVKHLVFFGKSGVTVIGKVLVDNGSSADILFLKTFDKMNLSQHMLDPPEYPLQGFGGKPIKPVGKNITPCFLRKS
jgi:hypothetical protein